MELAKFSKLGKLHLLRHAQTVFLSVLLPDPKQDLRQIWYPNIPNIRFLTMSKFQPRDIPAIWWSVAWENSMCKSARPLRINAGFSRSRWLVVRTKIWPAQEKGSKGWASCVVYRYTFSMWFNAKPTTIQNPEFWDPMEIYGNLCNSQPILPSLSMVFRFTKLRAFAHRTPSALPTPSKAFRRPGSGVPTVLGSIG